MRLVFMGTAQFAVPSLEALASGPHRVCGVVTQPDRPGGRGQRLRPPPVKVAAGSLGLDLAQPDALESTPFQQFIWACRPDALVVVAYGRLIPRWLIHAPERGVVNLHASLLPRYRGAAPVNWAIARGESQTGVCTMQIDEGLDTGSVYACRKLGIGPEETAPDLAGRLSVLGADLLVETISAIEGGSAIPTPQRHEDATLAPRMLRTDGYIRWSEPASDIHNKIRAFLPWPTVVAGFRGKRCRLLASRPGEIVDEPGPVGEIRASGGRLAVRCGDRRWLEILALQMENRKAGTGAEFLNGFRVGAGECFQSLAEAPARS